MPVSREQDGFDVIRTPDQMIAEAINCRQELLSGELQAQSYFVRDVEGWKVIYREDSGYEENSARDDDVVALLRLAEGVVSLNKNPLRPDHEPISLDRFFKKSIRDKQNFGSLHTRMSYDPLLTCVVLAQLEDIFEIPAEEKVFTGIQSELSLRPDVNAEIPVVSQKENEEHDTNNPKRNRIRRIATVATLGFMAVASIASCGLISNNTETGETLAPLIDTDSTTSIEITTTTILEKTCGDITVVEEGENLTQVADRCDKSLEQIVLWNGINNVDQIKVGQVLRLSEPEIITESSTVIPETTLNTTTTIAIPEVTTVTETPNVIPSTTIATPETTQPPPNDGVLTETQCSELGGFQHRFQYGEYLYNALQDIYGIQENQASALLKTPVIAKYRLEQITASTPGQKGAECMPDKSEILPYLPKPIFVTSTTAP